MKELLEAGQTLHAPMLHKLISRFAAFVTQAGLRRYNPFLLPIFTFVRKCCGVSDIAMETVLVQHSIDTAVYAPPDAPSRSVTPLAPLGRPSSRASAHVQSRHSSARSSRPDSRGLAASLVLAPASSRLPPRPPPVVV